jgi:hypothetical protein
MIGDLVSVTNFDDSCVDQTRVMKRVGINDASKIAQYFSDTGDAASGEINAVDDNVAFMRRVTSQRGLTDATVADRSIVTGMVKPVAARLQTDEALGKAWSSVSSAIGLGDFPLNAYSSFSGIEAINTATSELLDFKSDAALFFRRLMEINKEHGIGFWTDIPVATSVAALVHSFITVTRKAPFEYTPAKITTLAYFRAAMVQYEEYSVQFSDIVRLYTSYFFLMGYLRGEQLDLRFPHNPKLEVLVSDIRHAMLNGTMDYFDIEGISLHMLRDRMLMRWHHLVTSVLKLWHGNDMTKIRTFAGVHANLGQSFDSIADMVKAIGSIAPKCVCSEIGMDNCTVLQPYVQHEGWRSDVQFNLASALRDRTYIAFPDLVAQKLVS